MGDRTRIPRRHHQNIRCLRLRAGAADRAIQQMDALAREHAVEGPLDPPAVSFTTTVARRQGARGKVDVDEVGRGHQGELLDLHDAMAR